MTLRRPPVRLLAALVAGALWPGAQAAAQAAPAVAQIDVLPPTVTLAVGQRQGVLATAYDARGQVLPTVRITWSSTNAAVARVEQDPREPGVATIIGVAPGIASIEATAGGRRGQVAVQVAGAGAAAPGPVVPAQPVVLSNAVAIRIEPNSFYVMPSEELRVSLLFLQADGSPAAPMAVTWRSLNDAVATVDQNGSVVGIAPGQGVIEARTANDLVARAFVQVAGAAFAFASSVLSLSPGEDDTVRLVVPQQGNRRIASRWFTWMSSNPSIVVVSPLGVATGVSAGRAEVVASGFGQMARLIAVVHRVVEELAVVPRTEGPVTVPLSGTARFNAEPRDNAGAPVPEAPVVWEIGDTSIASFNPETRLATGKKIGRTTLRVRGPGRGLQATWTIDVVAAGLGFRPPRMGLGIGGRRTVEVMFANEQGEALAPATGIQWISLRPAVAQVDAQGTVTAQDYGYAPIVATTAWGRADTVHVYVQGELLVTSSRGRTNDLYAYDRTPTPRFNRVTTDTLANEFEGAHSPDGSRIAYVSDRDGNAELYVANADGSGVRRLTNTTATEGSPSWTPDGGRIVYASNASGVFQVWIINLDGTQARQLTQEPGSNFQPAVSPDGRLIAFASDRDAGRTGNYEVYVMSIEGTDQRNVSKSPASETAPAWLPDGQLAYVSEERQRNRVTVRVMKTNLTTGEQSLLVSLGGITVGDIEISPNGGTLALVATTFGQRGRLSQTLYLYSLSDPSVAPVEVPKASPNDVLLSPSFRR
jgi:Tol biopolymer transport system component